MIHVCSLAKLHETVEQTGATRRMLQRLRWRERRTLSLGTLPFRMPCGFSTKYGSHWDPSLGMRPLTTMPWRMASFVRAIRSG